MHQKSSGHPEQFTPSPNEPLGQLHTVLSKVPPAGHHCIVISSHFLQEVQLDDPLAPENVSAGQGGQLLSLWALFPMNVPGLHALHTMSAFAVHCVCVYCPSPHVLHGLQLLVRASFWKKPGSQPTQTSPRLNVPASQGVIHFSPTCSSSGTQAHAHDVSLSAWAPCETYTLSLVSMMHGMHCPCALFMYFPVWHAHVFQSTFLPPSRLYVTRP